MTTATTERGTIHETAIAIQGMHCASCVARVEKAVGRLPGVQACDVNLARERAVVHYTGDQTNPEQIADAISASGYQAIPESPSLAAGNVEEERLQHQIAHANAWKRRAILGLILWAPLELMHWTLRHYHWMPWVMAVGATVAIAFIGWGFYKGAWSALRRGTSNMDTLISMGASVAYVYSLVALVGSEHVLGRWSLENVHLYFTEAVGLLGLISLGHWMEARARTRAGSAIRELLELAPSTALRLDKQDQAHEVPVEKLVVGDRVLVRPGDRIPIDGEVVVGRSTVDEAMISGEPLPVMRKVGDTVIGGTINTDGRLVVQVRKTGSETALAQIVRLVEKAQSTKPPVQRLADRISAIFVPAVLLIALVTGLGWYAYATANGWEPGQTWGVIANAVCSVLIIACPCALGLAVPAALMVGIGRGAKRGILIRDIDALQHAERLNTVVLDKTGTITEGRPVVAKIVGIGEISQREVLRLAASAEQFSEHPLAKAIVAHARSHQIPLGEPDQFTNEPGLGIITDLEGQTILVGADALLQASGKVTSGYPPQGAGARTLVHLARRLPGGEVERLGLLVLADEIKSDSADAVAALKRMGLETVLLTGDNRATAAAVAKAVGIDDVRAEVKPDQKAAAIEHLKAGNGDGSAAQPNRVAMVGDGINDAPALATADLGIAIGSGSDIAKETGDIVLVSGSLKGIATSIRLSRATMRKIRQNLFFAFIYNVLAIPLAAFGLLNPLIAAAAMALSDVTVIGNALLLRRSRIDE